MTAVLTYPIVTPELIEAVVDVLRRRGYISLPLPCRGCGKPLDHETTSAYCTKCPITATEVLAGRECFPESSGPSMPIWSMRRLEELMERAKPPVLSA
jgi:hypothetical protein